MTENTPLQARQAEVAEYNNGIAMYALIAESLPSEWPAHLAHLKNSADKHNAIASVESLADVELVAKLWAHDDAQAAIRANYVEKSKAEAILAVMESQVL